MIFLQENKLTSYLILSFLSYLTFLVVHFQLEVTSFLIRVLCIFLLLKIFISRFFGIIFVSICKFYSSNIFKVCTSFVSRRFNSLSLYNSDIEATLFKYYYRKFIITIFIYKYYFKFTCIGNTFD